MSIILDALRRGRGRKTPLPNSDAARTDAVLHTLGYGRSNPNTPFIRLKRVLGFLALGIIMGIVLWGAVIWITQTYFAPSDVQDEPPAATPSQSDAGAAPTAMMFQRLGTQVQCGRASAVRRRRPRAHRAAGIEKREAVISPDGRHARS